MFCNELADTASGIVVPLLVLHITGSSSLAGIITAMGSAALVSSQLISGTVVDRWNPESAIVVSSMTQAICWIILSVLLWFDQGQWAIQWWMILLLVVATNIASSFDAPAEFTLIKGVVSKEQFGEAASVGQGRESIAELVGGPLGGALMGVSSGLAVAGQAVVNLVAAALIGFPNRLRHRSSPPSHDVHTPTDSDGAAHVTADLQTQSALSTSFVRDLISGYSHVWRHHILCGTSIVAGVANFPIVAEQLALLTYYQQHDVSALLIGVFTAAFGAGIILGSLGAGRMTRHIPLGQLGIIALGAFAFGQIVALLTYHSLWATSGVMFLSALPLPAFNAAIGAYTAAVTPENLMGRVTTATGVPGMILMPAGYLFAGLSYSMLGIRMTLVISAAVATIAVLMMTLDRRMRTIPLLRDLHE